MRMTVELLRPVPLAPLVVSRNIMKSGRTVTLIDACIFADGVEVAKARGLNLRRSSVIVPPQRFEAPPEVPFAQQTHSVAQRTAFGEAIEFRFVEGSWEELGPATLWTRLNAAVVDSEPVSAMQRVAAAADFANGISRVLDFDSHSFINADLTVALARTPSDEWVGFEMATNVSGEGFGQAESRIFDSAGTLGRSLQSLVITEVPGS